MVISSGISKSCQSLDLEMRAAEFSLKLLWRLRSRFKTVDMHFQKTYTYIYMYCTYIIADCRPEVFACVHIQSGSTFVLRPFYRVNIQNSVKHTWHKSFFDLETSVDVIS